MRMLYNVLPLFNRISKAGVYSQCLNQVSVYRHLFFLEGEIIASLSLKRLKGDCTLMVVKKSLVCYKIYYMFNFDGQNVCFHISGRPLFPSE